MTAETNISCRVGGGEKSIRQFIPSPVISYRDRCIESFFDFRELSYRNVSQIIYILSKFIIIINYILIN